MQEFRAKRKDNGEWVCSRSIIEQKTENGEKEIFMPQVGESNLCTVDENENLICIENCIFYKVIPETVGQYTGSTDKNGNKIFKGDIVKNEYRKGQYQSFKVVYDDRLYCWQVENKYGILGFLYNVIGGIEVIGNIHDNPELLKGGADNA